MPHKRIKKVFMSVVSLLFALSIGYFAVLPPTSAWFYQSLLNVENKQFIFGQLALSPTYLGLENIDLPAATKLEDPEEVAAFDEALYIERISAVNGGTLPARVYLTVTGNMGDPVSLHYFLYTDSDYDAAAAAVNPNATTSVMDIIRTRMNKYTGMPANIITNNNPTDINPTLTYKALDDYNLGDEIEGVSDEGNYVIIPPITTQNIYIAFWVDYNETGTVLKDTGNVAVHYTYDNIVIKLYAGQNTDGWFYDGTTHTQ